jgi:hypothetical protein
MVTTNSGTFKTCAAVKANKSRNKSPKFLLIFGSHSVTFQEAVSQKIFVLLKFNSDEKDLHNLCKMTFWSMKTELNEL